MSEEQWSDKLPESIRASSLMQGVDSEEKFWKRVQDQHSYAGSSIRIPSDDASDDDVAEFNAKLMRKVPALMKIPMEGDDEGYADALKKLGRPEKSEDYAAPEIDGYTFNDEELSFLRDTASDADMTKRQFNKLAKKYVANQEGEKATLEQTSKTDAELLKKEWGMLTEERQAEALDFVKRSGAPEHLIKKMESGKASASELLWLHGLAQTGKESSTVANQDTDEGATVHKLTPYEAEEKIREIQGNPDHPYHRSGGDLKNPSVIRMMELMEMTG